MRNQHAVGPTGNIMIEGAKRLRAAHSTGPKKLPQMLLRFGVNRKKGMAGCLVCEAVASSEPVTPDK